MILTACYKFSSYSYLTKAIYNYLYITVTKNHKTILSYDMLYT